jgi:hypothetical protein
LPPRLPPRRGGKVAPESEELGRPSSPNGADDPVEIALAMALTEAAKAGRFDVVAQLARELEARRLAGSNVAILSEGARRRATR